MRIGLLKLMIGLSAYLILSQLGALVFDESYQHLATIPLSILFALSIDRIADCYRSILVGCNKRGGR